MPPVSIAAMSDEKTSLSLMNTLSLSSSVRITHIACYRKFCPLRYIQVLCQYRLCRADHAYLILCYNGSLVTWTVLSSTNAKFVPLIFSVSGFTVSYTANVFILIILYDFCLLELGRSRDIASEPTKYNTIPPSVLPLLHAGCRLATAVVSLLISRSLSKNVSICHSMYFLWYRGRTLPRSRLSEAVKISACIRKVPCLNLSRPPTNLRVFRDFTTFLQANDRIIPWNITRPLSATIF
jgi:hypothetical protein